MTDAPRSAESFIEDQARKWVNQLARGKLIKMKDVGREGWSFWARKAWTFHIQSDFRVKVLVIERIEFDHEEGKRAYDWAARPGTIEYRLGYYTVGAYKSGKGRWLWGQYSPMIPQRDFEELIAEARAEGTII